MGTEYREQPAESQVLPYILKEKGGSLSGTEPAREGHSGDRSRSSQRKTHSSWSFL